MSNAPTDSATSSEDPSAPSLHARINKALGDHTTESFNCDDISIEQIKYQVMQFKRGLDRHAKIRGEHPMTPSRDEIELFDDEEVRRLLKELLERMIVEEERSRARSAETGREDEYIKVS